jgi:hypothetical protein
MPPSDRGTNTGHTPKRTRLDTSGNSMNVGNQSAPGGFMRDARNSYNASPVERQLQVIQVAQEGDTRGKRKEVETVPSEDSYEEEFSMSEKARMLGYGAPKNVPGTSSATRVSLALDHYPAYLDYLARPRITDGVVENVGEPLQNELTYEEFLRDLLQSRSDKRYMWRQQLERIPGANLDAVIESPIDQSLNTGDYSSQEARISSDSGDNNVVHSSTVHITEIPSSPVNTSPSGVRPSVPAVLTPYQPQPVHGSSRI